MPNTPELTTNFKTIRNRSHFLHMFSKLTQFVENLKLSHITFDDNESKGACHDYATVYVTH